VCGSEAEKTRRLGGIAVCTMRLESKGVLEEDEAAADADSDGFGATAGA
jgi:hypothetical protein